MFSQIYGMNYYNAVLLYSSFHHGISKWFISVNYSTPWGGKLETGTHSSLLSQAPERQEPTLPLDPAQPEPPSLSEGSAGTCWAAQPLPGAGAPAHNPLLGSFLLTARGR